MKTRLLLVILFLFASSARAQYGPNWHKLAQFGSTPQYISAIYFIDDNIGFVGIYGTTSSPLKRTTDGGLSWQPCITPNIPFSILFEDIWFRDAQNGWLTFAYGQTNNLWKTTDGGLTWNAVAAFPDVGGMTVRQTSKALSICAGIPGNVANSGIYVSTNNGGSFQLYNNSDNYAGMDFADDQHGVAAGLYSAISITNDGGVSWSVLSGAQNIEAFGVYAIKGTPTFFAVPEDIFNRSIKNALRSDDYGQTWNTLSLPPYRPTGDIKGVTNPKGTLLFIQETRYQNAVAGVMRSTDMGNTWQSIGGPYNISDTRLFVQQCGNKIFAADTNCALWVTYNGGDGTHFACSLSDSLQITATLCDSVKRIHYLHNPHPGDSVYVIEARIVDSTRKSITSRAFGFDSIPNLYYLLKQNDSMGFALHWKPRRLTDTAITTSTTIRFVTVDKKTGVSDTINIPVTLIGTDVLPQFTATSILSTSALACLARDTTISIQNQGCDTLWITAGQLSQHTNWSMSTALPIAILPGRTSNLSLHLLPISPSLADTLKLTMHYLRHDTTATIYLQGKTYARDPFSTSTFVHLDSVLMCATTDTLISLLDTLCGAMTITSITSDSSQWAFFTGSRDTIKFPLQLQDSLGLPLRVEYTPRYLQESRDTLRITYQYFDSTFTRKIPLRGSAQQTSGFGYGHTFNFGAHSTCAPFDTTITLQNQTCVKALINSISVNSAFEVLDTLPLSVDTNGFVTLHLRFSPKAPQNYNATATFSFTEYGLPASDSLTLTGSGIVTPATFTITPPLKSIDFQLTECDKPDTIQFDISNPSCDSLPIQAVTITGTALNVVSLKIDRPAPFMLGGTKTAHVILVTSNITTGKYTGSLVFHLGATDTIIPINDTITRMPRTVVMDTTPIDLGSLKPCETRTVAISYTNTGCTLDSVIGWTLSNWSLGFNVFGTGKNPPYVLTPGQTDTLHITFDGHHTGTIYDTVRVGFSTDENQTRSISVKTYVPSIDSVLFTVRMPAKLGSNQEFTAEVLPNRSVTGKAIYTIAGSVEYPANDFDFVSIKEGANLSLTSTGPTNDPKIDKLGFVLSNSSGISLDPTAPVLTLRFRTVLTDTISYTISVDSIVLNGSNPDFAQCTLAAGGTQSSAAFDPACNDSLFILSLQGARLLLASDPMPNPASITTTLHLQSNTNGSLEVELRDALGRIVRQNLSSLASNTPSNYDLDVSTLSAGAYTVAIKFTSSMGATQLLRRILVIH